MTQAWGRQIGYARYGQPGPVRKRWCEITPIAPSFELAAICVIPTSDLHLTRIDSLLPAAEGL
jgi:hypothetical protein